MLMAPDIARKFPLQSIPYVDLSTDDVFEQLLALKRANCSEWTDESTSDFGVQLLWLYSVLGRWLIDHMDRVMLNSYLATATSRESVRKLCEMVGYTMAEASAASVTVTFTCAGGHPLFTIPAATKVSTVSKDGQKAIIFETVEDTTVNVGVNSINIVCGQGETVANEILGSSDMSAGQRFTLKRPNVVWHSEIIEVNDGAGWLSWTRVDHFVSSLGTDLHYRAQLTDDGKYAIIFNDGVRGRVPTRGINNIRATYRTGGGSIGNIGAGRIVELPTPIQYVTAVSNAAAASGGSERESLEHARLFAPALVRTLDRCVTLRDIETLSMLFDSPTFGRIAQAKAIEKAGVAFSVMIIPRSGGIPSPLHKSELQTYLGDRKMISTAIEVVDPVFHEIHIVATVTPMPNYAPSELASRIRERLVAYISPAFQDPSTGIYPHGFGRDIYVSDLYSIIDNTNGVHHCSVGSPVSDIVLNDYEIAEIGSIMLTINEPAGQFSFYSDREGLDEEFREWPLNEERQGPRGTTT